MTATAQENDLRLVLGDRFNLANVEGKRFTSRFIEPGIVSYEDMGLGYELLRKSTIDKCLNSARGNGLTIGHVGLATPADRTNGSVEDVRYNAADGWYYAEGSVLTDDARSLMRRGQLPSCAYRVKALGPGGVYHGIRYNREITELEFHHLAIVEKPRYEDANFRLNARTINPQNTMFKFITRIISRINGADGKAEKTNIEETPMEVSPESSLVIDGAEVRINDLAAVWRTQKGQIFHLNSSEEVEIELDGKKERVNMGTLINCYGQSRKNEDEAKQREKEQKEEETKVERENALKTEAAKKAADEKAAADKKAADEETARKNEAAKKAASLEPFYALHNARENATDKSATKPTNSGSIPDRVNKGIERYGSVKPGNN